MDQVSARMKFQSALSKQVKMCSMKLVTLAKLTGADRKEVSRWVSGDLVPDYRSFLRLKEIFGATDEQFAGKGFRNEQEYNSFFRLHGVCAKTAGVSAGSFRWMGKSLEEQAARAMDHSDEINRSRRKNGGSRRKGRDVGVLSKANGYRP